MTLKHWTEPNGVFLIHIPADWQYRNPVFDKFEEKSPYSFEAYENSIGCFQLSCYPLSEKGVSPNLTIQKANSKIEWLESKVRDPEFEVHLWHAQVDDQLCFAKCIYDIKYRKKSKAKKLLKRVRASLDSLRVKPENERNYFRALDKYDNFNASLAASYDMREKAFYSNSYIEIIAIISNQIDAFLRIAIVLKKQLNQNTKEIEVKYLFQDENEKGIIERRIYKEALDLEIINDEHFKELNDLYDLRNRVVHRYIISYLKTRDIKEIALDYYFLSEKIRLIIKSIEEEQMDRKIGIYGEGYEKDYKFTRDDQQVMFSLANDKHLLEEFQRKINKSS